MQLFARQAKEDGANPSAKWGQDLPAPATAEVEDPDDEDHMPIPAATPVNDDDDDDVEILEILEARPLKYAYPMPSAIVNPEGQAPSSRPATTGNPGVSRKHADNGTSDTETPTPPAPAVKKQRIQKKPGDKPRKKKGPPVTEG